MKNVLLSNKLRYFFLFHSKGFCLLYNNAGPIYSSTVFKDSFLILYAFSSPQIHVVHAFRSSKARTFQDRLHMKSYSSADQTQLMHSVSSLQSDF